MTWARVKSFQEPLCLRPFQVLAEGLEVILFPLELGGGVDLAGAHLEGDGRDQPGFGNLKRPWQWPSPRCPSIPSSWRT